MNVTLAELAKFLGAQVFGDENTIVTTLSPIDEIQVGALVFAEGDENIQKALASEAKALLVSDKTEVTQKPCLKVAAPYQAFIQLLSYFYPPIKITPGIHPTAIIDPSARIAKTAQIGAYVVIEADCEVGEHVVIKSHVSLGASVVVGEHSVLHPNVVVYPKTQIGARVSIHASSVIGSDGFGYQYHEGQHQKIPHVGYVCIEDDVEIGANTVIDRATLGATRIGHGTKIDNLVQVAHNVKLGAHNILCAFTGVAGSSTSGSNVIFAANVGVSDHVTIESGVILGARAGVPSRKTLKAGNIYLGMPARPKDKAIEVELGVSRIPMMRKNMKALSEKVEALSKQLIDNQE